MSDDDDPELVAFEAGVRRRNVIVYAVGGSACLPVGAFFAALGFSVAPGHRVATMGIAIFMLGVMCLVQSWRLAHGGAITPEQAAPDDPAHARRRKVAFQVTSAATMFVAGAILFSLGSVYSSSRINVFAAGVILGGLLTAHRAWVTAHSPLDEP